MKNHFKLSSLVLLSCISLHATAFAIPSRVVTLTPALGELAADILGMESTRIVGVSAYTDYPPVLKTVESVGSYVHLNLEKILSLKPDLVLASYDGNSKEQIDHLKDLGLFVVIVRSNRFAEIEASMVQVGQSLGMDDAGRKMAVQFRRGLTQLSNQHSSSGVCPRVLLQVGDAPLVVAGGGSLLSEALVLLGAQNVYSEGSVHYPKPSYEDAVARNPDLVVILKMGVEVSTNSALLHSWVEFSNMKAVISKKVRIIQNDALLRPTSRMLEGLAVLESVIYKNAEEHRVPSR